MNDLRSISSQRVTLPALTRPCSTALIVMPFASIKRPSIQVGLLKAIGERQGFKQQTFHFNIDFAMQIGCDLYEGISDCRQRLFGDWLFSLAAFGEAAPDRDDQLLTLHEPAVRRLFVEVCREKDADPDRLSRIRRDEVEHYLDSLIDACDWSQFAVVGFTSTFQQSVAAVAFARRLKARFPDLITLFGGANLEGEMGEELLRRAPAIDYAISGEADDAYPAFLTALTCGAPVSQVPGLIYRQPNGRVTTVPARAPRMSLDDLPVPDYSEYFARAEAKGLLVDSSAVMLPFESSRGCWWGQKSHCTFCGLNAESMVYRSKQPSRVLSELADQSKRHGTFRFEAVDNILDVSYFSQLFPALRDAQQDYEFFYEVKSNLSREKLKTLREGGVTQIQPGIESLDSRILKLMRKGVTAIQNVNLLRWALYYDISVNWNVIYGFPGERREDYASQVDLFKHIVHLQPPKGCGKVWLERFSPLFSDSVSYPLESRAPEDSYHYVFPHGTDLNKLAYFFDYQLKNTLPDDAFGELRSTIETWQAQWQSGPRPQLTFCSAPGIVRIDDSRSEERRGRYLFRDGLAQLYRECSDAPRTPQGLRDELGLPWSADEIRDALLEFCARGLMMRDNDKFLSLALPFVRMR